MATLTFREIRANIPPLAKSVQNASRILRESAKVRQDSYDVFLSHSILDASDITGLKVTLEKYGYSVYVDWVEDPQLDRTKVTTETAAILRSRMQSCRALFFATSENSDRSKWMPWECGFFDGLKGRVAILPITEDGHDYRGQEYLGLYPFVSSAKPDGKEGKVLWVDQADGKYVSFERWLKGEEPSKH